MALDAPKEEAARCVTEARRALLGRDWGRGRGGYKGVPVTGYSLHLQSCVGGPDTHTPDIIQSPTTPNTQKRFEAITFDSAFKRNESSFVWGRITFVKRILYVTLHIYFQTVNNQHSTVNRYPIPRPALFTISIPVHRGVEIDQQTDGSIHCTKGTIAFMFPTLFDV